MATNNENLNSVNQNDDEMEEFEYFDSVDFGYEYYEEEDDDDIYYDFYNVLYGQAHGLCEVNDYDCYGCPFVEDCF
ncbi:MAG TPA: hypothetical protein PK887_04520 [Ignavibacteriales bacterium]|nr:hypothetical protein [Ignavibacteriales bacterium]